MAGERPPSPRRDTPGVDPDVPGRVGSELLRHGRDKATERRDAVALGADRAEHIEVRAPDVWLVLPDQRVVVFEESTARRATAGLVRSRHQRRAATARAGPSSSARSTRPQRDLDEQKEDNGCCEALGESLAAMSRYCASAARRAAAGGRASGFPFAWLRLWTAGVRRGVAFERGIELSVSANQRDGGELRRKSRTSPTWNRRRSNSSSLPALGKRDQSKAHTVSRILTSSMTVVFQAKTRKG